MRVQSVEFILIPASRAEASRIFSGLKSGDTIQADITDVNGSRIILKTQDGKTVQADFRGGVQLQPGDQVELMMNSLQGKQISLRMLSLNGQQLRPEVSVRENLLLRAGIEPSAQNIRLAGILQENGFMPAPETISNLAKIMKARPDLPSGISAFLAANHLKPDEETLSRLDRLITRSPQTGERIGQLSDAFTRLLADTEAAPGQKAQSAAGTAQADPLVQTGTTWKDPGNVRIATSGNKPTATEGETQLLRALVTFLEQGESAFLLKGAPADQIPASSQPVKDIASLLSGAKNPAEIIKLLASLPKQEAETAAAILAGKEPLGTQLFSGLLSFLKLPVQERQSLLSQLPVLKDNPGLISVAFDTVPENPVLPKQPAMGNGGNAPGTSVTENGGGPGILKESTQAQTPASLLDTAMKVLHKMDGLFVHLKADDIPAAAKDLRETVINQEMLTKSIASDLARLAGDKSAITRQAGELQAQVQFTSGLEQFFYFQIPVRFENQKNTAELYIFERNSRSKATREQSSVLIALETQNLGRVETMLKCEGNSLEVNFRLDSEAFSGYLKKEAASLKQSLAESGFQIKSMQFGLIEKKTTPLNAQELFSRESRLPAAGLDIQI